MLQYYCIDRVIIAGIVQVRGGRCTSLRLDIYKGWVVLGHQRISAELVVLWREVVGEIA